MHKTPRTKQYSFFFKSNSISQLSQSMKKILLGAKIEFQDLEELANRLQSSEIGQEKYQKIKSESKKCVSKGQYKKAFNIYLKRGLTDHDIPLIGQLEFTRMRLYCAYKMICKHLQKLVEGLKKDNKKLERVFEQYFESLECFEFLIDIFQQLKKVKTNYNNMTQYEKDKCEVEEEELLNDIIPKIPEINFTHNSDELYLYILKGQIQLYKFNKLRGEKEIALAILNKLKTLIEVSESQFVISNYKIIRFCGQALMLIGNMYLENKQLDLAEQYYERSYEFYMRCVQGNMVWFAQNKPEDFTIKKEKQFEKVLKEFALLSYTWSISSEYRLDFSHSIETMRLGTWLCERLFLYNDSMPVKTLLQDRLRLLNKKYDYFLKETFDVQKFLKLAFPEEAKILKKQYCMEHDIPYHGDDENNQINQETDRTDKDNIIHQINQKMYNKYNYKDFNERNFIITQRPTYSRNSLSNLTQTPFNSQALKQLPSPQYAKQPAPTSDTNISSMTQFGQRVKHKNFTMFNNTLSPSNDDITTQISENNLESQLHSNNLNVGGNAHVRKETDMQLSQIDSIQEFPDHNLFPKNKLFFQKSPQGSPRQKRMQKKKKKQKSLNVDEYRRRKFVKENGDDKYVPKCLTSDKYFKTDFKKKYSSKPKKTSKTLINPSSSQQQQEYFIQAYQDFNDSPAKAKKQLETAEYEVQKEEAKAKFHQKNLSDNQFSNYLNTNDTTQNQTQYNFIQGNKSLRSMGNLSPIKTNFELKANNLNTPLTSKTSNENNINNNHTNQLKYFQSINNSRKMSNIPSVPRSARDNKKHLSYSGAMTTLNGSATHSNLFVSQSAIKRQSSQPKQSQQLSQLGQSTSQQTMIIQEQSSLVQKPINTTPSNKNNNEANKNTVKIEIDNEIDPVYLKHGHTQQHLYKHLKIKQREGDQVFDKTDPEDKMNEYEKIKYRMENPVKVNNLDDEMQKCIFDILSKDESNHTLRQQYLPKYYKFLDLMKEETFDRKDFKFGQSMVEFKKTFNIKEPDQEKNIAQVDTGYLNKIAEFCEFDSQLGTIIAKGQLNSNGKKAQENRKALEKLQREEEERKKQGQKNKLQRMLLAHKTFFKFKLVNQYHMSNNDKNKKNKRQFESQANLGSTLNLESTNNLESKTSLPSDKQLKLKKLSSNQSPPKSPLKSPKKSPRKQPQQMSLLQRLQQSQKFKVDQELKKGPSIAFEAQQEFFDNSESQKKSQDIIRRHLFWNEQEKDKYTGCKSVFKISPNNSISQNPMYLSYNSSQHEKVSQAASAQQKSPKNSQFYSPRAQPTQKKQNQPYLQFDEIKENSDMNSSHNGNNKNNAELNRQKSLKDFIKEWPTNDNLAKSTNGQHLKAKAERGFISIQELVNLAKIQKQKEIQKQQELNKSSSKKTPKRLSIFMHRSSVTSNTLLPISQALIQKTMESRLSSQQSQQQSQQLESIQD